MSYSEDQLLPISALQHLLFCERQCALIHIEQIWSENQFTAEGKVLHERAHNGPDESRPGIRITRSLSVRSIELGISGQCDVVEFHEPIPGGLVLPVEYKRGKPKSHRADEVQLCAQAICLEEMLDVTLERGALYYGERRHRTDIIFDHDLRTLTRDLAQQLHQLIHSRRTPPARMERKCETCSLLNDCMPRIFNFHSGASAWFFNQLEALTQNNQ